MDAATNTPGTVIVRASGELDRNATHRLVDDVLAQVTESTELIVVSLEETTAVHWNALCILGRAAQAWRDAAYHVVVREARPSLRSVLGSVEGIGLAV
jgi:anti-anti-sigma regulatory factor